MQNNGFQPVGIAHTTFARSCCTIELCNNSFFQEDLILCIHELNPLILHDVYALIVGNFINATTASEWSHAYECLVRNFFLVIICFLLTSSVTVKLTSIQCIILTKNSNLTEMYKKRSVVTDCKQTV